MKHFGYTFADVDEHMLSCFCVVHAVPSVRNLFSITFARAVEDRDIKVCLVVDVYVGPAIQAKPNNTTSSSIKSGTNQVRNLNRNGILESGVREAIFSDAVNGRREDDVSPCVSWGRVDETGTKMKEVSGSPSASASEMIESISR